MQKKKSIKFKLIDAAVVLLCAACSIFSGAMFWKEYDRTLSKLNEEPIGTITFKKRTVQRKFLENVIWDRLRQESPIYNGDTIRTIEVSEAVITFRDISTRLILNENTLIQIYYTEEHGAMIDFSGGNMAVDSRIKPVMITSGSSRIIVEGQANLLKIDEGFSLSVTDGTVNLNGEELNQGDIFTLDSDGTRAQTPAIAITSFGSSVRVLTLPGDLYERAVVDFTWNAVNFAPDTRVVVDIALDRDFNRIMYRGETKDSSITMIVSSGSYWWRAFASEVDNEPAGKIYPTGTLEVMLSSPPRLITPAWQEEFPTDVNPVVNFLWTSSGGASAYLLEISPNSGMNGVVFSRSVQGTSIAVPDLDTGGYFWRVTPVLPDWVIGELPPSPTGSFAILQTSSVAEQPPAPITPQIEAAPDEEEMLSATLSESTATPEPDVVTRPPDTLMPQPEAEPDYIAPLSATLSESADTPEPAGLRQSAAPQEVNVISADAGWHSESLGGNAFAKSRTITNLSFSREINQGSYRDVMIISVNLASGNEWRHGQIFILNEYVVQRLRAASGVRFKVLGDGKRGWFFTLPISETSADGGHYQMPLTTRAVSVVDVDIPFTSMRQPDWARKFRFNRETIEAIQIHRHADGNESFSGESTIQIFDFEIY